MHFGRIESSQSFDMSLPPDTVRTQRFLNLPHGGTTRFYVGCPIWACRAWVGSLYPPKTKASDFLREYAKKFNAVEVNSTFYHLPDVARIAQWREQVAEDFRFCPKVYRGITEQLGSSRLPQLVSQFCEGIKGFGDRLGLVFAQLPESIGPRQEVLVANFLRNWPTDIALALEFRHPGWFSNHGLGDDVIDFLYRQNIATVITDTPGRRDVLHLSLTQPRVMIRFQGNESIASDHDRLSKWADRLSIWKKHALEDIYFFTHQPSEAFIPENAQFLRDNLQ